MLGISDAIRLITFLVERKTSLLCLASFFVELRVGNVGGAKESLNAGNRQFWQL
jgi:hypothetical protein